MVKQLPNWLKIGLQSRFGPNFVVEFEAFFQKKFGLAYCVVFVVKSETTIACQYRRYSRGNQ